MAKLERLREARPRRLDRRAGSREDFAFESTLSGLGYVGRLKRWKKADYNIEMKWRLIVRKLGTLSKRDGEAVKKALGGVLASNGLIDDTDQ